MVGIAGFDTGFFCWRGVSSEDFGTKHWDLYIKHFLSICSLCSGISMIMYLHFISKADQEVVPI